MTFPPLFHVVKHLVIVVVVVLSWFLLWSLNCSYCNLRFT